MKFKTTMLMAFLLLLILAIGAVSAADGNETVDALAIENDADDVGLNSSDSDLTANDESVVLGEEPGTFTDLNDEIEACSQDTLVLSRNYDGDGTSISISKPITIDGKDYTLDAKGGRAFEIASDNVIITNLNIINAFSNGSSGAAISIEGDNCIIINCTIVGSHSGSSGGAIYFMGNNGLIDNVTISNSTSFYKGGAIYLRGSGGMISNSRFIDCSGDFGGAIAIEGDSNIVNNSSIENSEANSDGGAIYVMGNGYKMSECNAYNASSNSTGGAVYVLGADTIINASTFKNCFSNKGGAIFVNGSATTILDSHCSFCNATDGGAIYAAGNSTFILGVDIIDTTSFDRGAIYLDGSDCLINGSYFKFNKAECGGAIYIAGFNSIIENSTFVENNVSQSGGSIYVYGNLTNITESFFSKSFSSIDGGAVYIEGDDSNILNSEFESSHANQSGGAIFIAGFSSIIWNSTFVGNNVSQYGGSVCVYGNFINITESFFSMSSSIGHGGAVYIQGDYSNILNSEFENSCASQNGGAIYSEGSYSNVNCSNFTDNVAANGGAIYRGGNYDNKYFVVSDSIFLNNTAYPRNSNDRGGGAIFYNQGSEIFIRNSQFYNNSVLSNTKANGGAIVYYLSRNGCMDNCTFDGNYIFTTDSETWCQGGAVLLKVKNNYTISNCIFKNSWSQKEAGALYVSNDGSYGMLSILVVNTTFINNTANGTAVDDYNCGGGAVLVKECDYVCFKNATFINNSANNGGGLCLVRPRSDSNQFVDCTFIGNNASIDGGSIWAQSYIRVHNITLSNSRAGACGGGLFVTGRITAYNNLTFINNTAQRGGGIYWNQANSRIENMTFIKNHAETGGAVYISVNGFNVLNNLFVDNSADLCGGAVYTMGAGTNITNNGFTNNSAQSGGAVYINGDMAKVLSNSFVDNSADLCGGAVYTMGSNINIVDNGFTNNSAQFGGALYIMGSNVDIVDNGFTNNSAQFGGAIYINGSRIKIEEDNFNNNHADYGGAIFVEMTDRTSIYGSNFTKNHADNYGGAIFSPDIPLVVILGSDFIDNTAERGGAIYNCTFENCTVEGKGPQIYPDNRTAPSIEITVDVIGDTAVIHVALPGDVEGNVTVTINGINQTLNLVNGVGSITLTGLAKGTFEVTVTFDGNDMYLKTANSTSFTVSMETPALTINADNMKPNESQTITVQLPDSATGNVTFRLYYEGLIFIEESCELSGSAFTPFKWAMIEVNDLPIGSYNITVDYGGDDSYLETSDYALFTVSPRINMTSEIIKGDNLEIAIDFGNLTNMTISGEVNVYIDGEKYALLRISGSRLNFLISTEDIPLESHSVVLQYGGTTFSEDIFRLGAGKSYVPMAYEVHISPREIFVPSKLISDDVGDVVFEMPVDSVGMLAISLDTGESVAIINMSNYANRTGAFEETVSSVLADCEVTIKKTEDDRLIITMTFSQRKGEIGVVLEYTGDGKYSPFRKVAAASVNHRSPVIIAGDLSMIYSSNRVYSVVVYGSDGKAAMGVQVSFLVNGRFIGSAFTNANGVAGIKITNAPGSYSITAKALGTGATKRLTVSHVLSLKTVKVKKSAKKLVLKATLKKVNGKYLKGKKITFKFNGKTYKAKTNKKGVAKVTIKKAVLKKLKVGKKIRYQATYLKDTVKKTVKVKK